MQPQAYLQTVIAPLLNRPDQLSVEHSVDERGVLLRVKCAPHDMGPLIGKGGNNASAMRTLLRTFGMRKNERINVVFDDQRTVRDPAITNKQPDNGTI